MRTASAQLPKQKDKVAQSSQGLNMKHTALQLIESMTTPSTLANIEHALASIG
jgi:pyruvate/2-oxoacid:ferredoxin oxidoreductase alpha subunit